MLSEDTLRGSGVKSATGISKSIDRAGYFLDPKVQFYFWI